MSKLFRRGSEIMRKSKRIRYTKQEQINKKIIQKKPDVHNNKNGFFSTNYLLSVFIIHIL